MKKILIVSLVLIVNASLAFAGTLQIETYYPSPTGSYDSIRLVPRDSVPPLPATCNPGTLYTLNSPTSHLQFCNDDGTWSNPPSAWTQTGTNLYPTDTDSSSITVSVGTASAAANPASLLYLNENADTGSALRVDFKANAGDPDPIYGIYTSHIPDNNETRNFTHLFNNIYADYDDTTTIGVDNFWTGPSSMNDIKIGLKNSGSIFPVNASGNDTGTFKGLTNEFTSAQINGTGHNLYGLYNNIAIAAAAGQTQTVYGTYSEGTTTGGGTNIFYGNYVKGNAASTTGSQYAYFADMAGAPTTEYGLYLNGETKNYLSGNLGIGVVDPQAMLDIHSPSGPASILLSTEDVADAYYETKTEININGGLDYNVNLVSGGITNPLISFDYDAQSIGLFTAADPNSAFMLQIGSSSAGGKVNFVGNAPELNLVNASGGASAGDIKIKNTSNKTTFAYSGGGIGTFTGTIMTIDGTTNLQGYVGIGTTVPANKLDIVGNINVSGCYKAAGVAFQGVCVSDQNLKENIQSLKGSLEKISNLNPVHFDFKDPQYGPKNQTGLIAQEVEKIFPDWVSKDPEGNKAINYGLQIQMHIIEAIKELKEQMDQKVDSLEKENQELRKEIQEMKKRSF